MFSKEFYPTPLHVLDMMGIECKNKVVLEPSAGKGNIIDYVKAHGAKNVIACELHDELQHIVRAKAQLIGSDFFNVTSVDVSHIHMIVMNPPFSNADRHIIHAWNIAPEGCEIIALCNWQTVRDWDTGYRSYESKFENIVKENGRADNLGSCFDTAERKTGVEVGLVRLFKPIESSNFTFDGFFIEEDTTQENGLIKYNDIKAIVNSYVAAVKCWDDFEITRQKLNNAVYHVDFAKYGGGVVFKADNNQYLSNKKDFSIALQKHCWEKVFKQLQVEKYVTKRVMEDLQKFIVQQSIYPFTMKNIYRMIEILIGTREQTMNRAVVEAIDNFTKHTHENRYSVEGWKTNEGHMLNRKFISGWISEPNWSRGLGIKEYNGNFQYLKDLTKALCYLTGTDYNTIADIRQSSCKFDGEGKIILDEKNRPLNENEFTPNTWYEWGFFRFKVFKKGTGHFIFKDRNVWELVNKTYAKIKGQVLPETSWRNAA